ncbi:MAG: hypothetical protein ACR2NH_06460, partial [Solirubrobacteraceae bacterium]
PYSAQLDITDVAKRVLTDDACKDFAKDKDPRGCREAGVNAVVAGWRAANAADRSGHDVLVAVHNYLTGGGSVEPGWQIGPSLAAAPGSPVRLLINDGTLNRPLTSAAHEFGHALGAPHADSVDTDPETNAKCGGNANGEYGEPWPSDNAGRLQGVAFGKYTTGAFTTRGDNVAVDRTVQPSGIVGGRLYDIMSYCGANSGEASAWLSPRQWRRMFQTLQGVAGRRGSSARQATATVAAQATVAGQAFAVGTVGPGGVKIERIIPADPGNGVPAGVNDSPLRLKVTGASGQPLGQVGASVETMTDAPAGTATFTAPLPAGAAVVEATTAAGQVLDRVARSRPPTIRLVPVRAATLVGGRARDRLVVRWKAADPDQDPLQATVEYSAGGEQWRTVYQGADRGQAVVPGQYLEASARARVRVTVNDGFDRARATSGRFRAAGAPPVAKITAPVVGVGLPQDVDQVLTGQATGDGGRPLSGRRLTWFAGAKRLGTGAVLRASLPAGTVKLRLQARDRQGRTTNVTRTVRVEPVRLRITRLVAPPRVRAGATTATITLATSVPATLRVGGRAYAVGPKARKLSVKLPSRPRAGLLALTLRIRARGARQAPVLGTLAVLRL